MSFRSQLMLGFGAPLCILVLIGVFTYRQLRQETVDQEWVTHTHLVLEKLDASLEGLLEIESESRVSTYSDPKQEPERIRMLRAQVELDLAATKSLTKDNSEQQANCNRLKGLVGEELDMISAKAREGQIPAGVSAEAEKMFQIRELLLKMRQHEERLLSARQARAAQTNSRMKTILTAGYAFAFLLFALSAYSVVREIEKRRASEESMRRAQEQYRLLFDSNPIPVWVYDTKTLAILDVNATAIERYGYTREEFLRSKITDIRPEEDVSALMDDLGREQTTKQDSGPWRHRKKNGEIIDVQICSYPLKFSGEDARLVVATDITEQKRAEGLIRESETRFRSLVSNIKDYAITVLDPEGKVSSWNGGAQRIKGYTSEEIVGKHFSVFYTPEDIAVGKPDNELRIARGQGRFEDDGLRVKKDGSRFWANVVVTPLNDDAGRPRGFVKVTRDITEKRKAEQELIARSAELEAANKELESFSYSVSHDLRAPLRGIEGFSQALQEDYAAQLDGTATDYLRRIRAATRRMGELIDDLLKLARVTRAEIYREPVNLSRIAREIAQDFATDQPSRQVKLVIAEGISAECDSRLIRIVLQNLIGNAWKFTSKREDAEIEFGELPSNGSRTFFVRDNGAGFDPAYAARLFGTFQRLHAASEFPGTGIGLATVQRVVQRQGGSAWAEGAPGKGATIFFSLGPRH